MHRVLALVMLLSAARACKVDSDCASSELCNHNHCVGRGWGTAREKAEQNAGMAPGYTKHTWPMSVIDRPLVVAQGMTEARLGIFKDLSDNVDPTGATLSHPLGVDAYARFGVSARIQAGLDALGVCLDSCGGSGFFQGIAVGANYAAVANHEMNMVPYVSLALYNTSIATRPNGYIDTRHYLPLQFGTLFGWRIHYAVQLLASGGLALGVLGRSNALSRISGVSGSPDTLSLQFGPRFEVVPRVSVAPFIGYRLPFNHSELYTVPAGRELLIVADRDVDLGAAFQLLDIPSRPVTGGTGVRAMRVFLTVRL